MAKRWLNVLLVALSVALVAVVVVWIVGGDDSSPTAEEPEVVSPTQLTEFTTDRGTPVYWLGERPDESYELTESASGRVYVRYLPSGAEAGDKSADFVTVATYPTDNGVAELRKAADEQKGTKLGKTDDGAVLLIDPASPKNAHLAFPGANLQIEVYSPVPGEALRLAARGEVEPIS